MKNTNKFLALLLSLVVLIAAVSCGELAVSDDTTTLSQETTALEVVPPESEPSATEPFATEPASSLLPPEDYLFTIAVIPDTQQEVVVDSAIQNKHFLNRIQWLVDHAEALDLRCVIHTGDVVNWGNEAPEQFEIAHEAMAPLDSIDIPVLYAIGNHDTAAVTVGGSAADPTNTRSRQRDTTKFNEYFSLDHYQYLIPFEKDKIDNVYYIFTAAEAKWLVLSLELWPRDEVIDWAKNVVASNPDHNVIIVTHSYLTSTAGIYQNRDYGHNSPQALYDQLVSQYPNGRLVFSGHTGQAAHRVDTGVAGNRIASFLGCFHSNLKNPVQLLEVDTLLNSVSIRTYSPIDDDEWEQYAVTIEDMDFIMAED